MHLGLYLHWMRQSTSSDVTMLLSSTPTWHSPTWLHPIPWPRATEANEHEMSRYAKAFILQTSSDKICKQKKKKILQVNNRIQIS